MSNLNNSHMNIDNNNFSTTTQTTQTAQPFSSQHQHGLKEDSNDLSKPSFFKNSIGSASSSSSAQLNSSSASSLLSNQMGSTIQSSSIASGVVRDPLSLSDIEQRGALHSGLQQSTVSNEVLSTLKTKENDVLLNAAHKINDLKQKEHGVMGSNIHQSSSSSLSAEKKMHDIAVDAKSKLDQVRLTENKVQQNLSAAEQLRAMAHEREIIAEKQNAESMVAQTTAHALHPTATSKSHTTSSSSNSSLPSSTTTTNKLEQQHRPIVQQTTTTTVHQPADRYTRGA